MNSQQTCSTAVYDYCEYDWPAADDSTAATEKTTRKSNNLNPAEPSEMPTKMPSPGVSARAEEPPSKPSPPKPSSASEDKPNAGQSQQSG